MLSTGPQWLTPKLRRVAKPTAPVVPRPVLPPHLPPQVPPPMAPPPREGYFGRARRSPTPDPVTGPGHWEHRQYRGEHGAREYDVYVPGVAAGRRVPVVLLLHGCRQRSVEFAEETGFVAAADAEGVLILAPRQEGRHQLQRCWRWYEAEHQSRGRGEPAILAGIVEEVAGETERWQVDRRRVYAAGMSAGGAMALILATTYPDVIAAAGVHSATAYRSATQGLTAFGAMSAQATMPAHESIVGEMAPVVVIQGTNDAVVRAPNGDRIVDQWLASRDAGRLTGLDRVRPLATTRALVVDERRCIRTRWYTARGRRVLEYWRIDGLRHAWSGGRRKGAFVDLQGPAAAQIMMSFFQRHKRPSAAFEPVVGAGGRSGAGGSGQAGDPVPAGAGTDAGQIAGGAGRAGASPGSGWSPRGADASRGPGRSRTGGASRGAEASPGRTMGSTRGPAVPIGTRPAAPAPTSSATPARASRAEGAKRAAAGQSARPDSTGANPLDRPPMIWFDDPD